MSLEAVLLPKEEANPGHDPVRNSLGVDEMVRETWGGTAILRPGAREDVHHGGTFVAAWTSGVALDPSTRASDAIPTLAETRAGALVVADSEGLHISRGPYGGRPLYYARSGGQVLVSSSLMPIVKALGAGLGLDIDCLGALGLSAARPDPRSTPYATIKRVLPCETVSFTRGPLRSSFSVPPPPSVLPGDARDHAHALREELEGAIRRALRHGCAPAVFAGGGLDSSGLLALVAQAARSRGHRFTALAYDFSGPGDDRPHLVALLDMLQADALRVSPRDIRELPTELFVQDAAPCTWPTCPAELLAAGKARAWGADMLVSGSGGDDVLDGDLGRFAERVLDGDLVAIVDAMRQHVPWTRSARIKANELIVKPVLRRLLPDHLLARRRARKATDTCTWAGPRLRKLLASEPLPPEGDRFVQYALDHGVMDYSEGRSQTEVACGLPWEDPYLDPAFVEFVASLPSDELFYGRRQRGLYREAMRGLIPETLRLRPDKASFEPLGDEMFAAAGGFEGFADLLTMEASADLELVVPEAFRRTFERVTRKEHTARGWLEVWPMLAVETFLRMSRSAPGITTRGSA